MNNKIIKSAVKTYTLEWLKEIELKSKIEVPETLDERILNLIKTHKKSRKYKVNNIKTIKLIIIAAILAFLITSLSVSAIRDTIKNFFIEFFSTHKVVSYNIENHTYPKTIEKVYGIKNIPDEYELIDNTVTDTSVFVLYLSEDKQIMFEQFTKEHYKEYISVENTENESIVIDEIKYYITYIKESSEYKIIWEKDGYVFSLISGMNKEKIIELCKNVS